MPHRRRYSATFKLGEALRLNSSPLGEEPERQRGDEGFPRHPPLTLDTHTGMIRVTKKALPDGKAFLHLME
ncbi:hypothetical protein [Rhizobium sp. BK376]|uniref:hypothetical protein n=1 Tax=Rhizobium sp. BK376 TaxID=2512149 RepID=UPI00104BDCD9|nr:hypothetical protein [Rhizobium sp. BK376]TCR85508.1 hypothetical protein EV561_107285 [Rhizobium sp. BK376]